jgi:hypothetical protein
MLKLFQSGKEEGPVADDHSVGTHDTAEGGSVLSGGSAVEKVQKEGFFHKVKRPQKPYKRAHYVAVSGRNNLEGALLNSKDKNNPDLNFVMKLGMHLLVGDFNFMCTKTGCMLVEFAYNRGVDFTAREQRAAAKGHLDTFLAEGIYAEQYHLRRSKHLYSNLLAGIREGKDGYGLKKGAFIQARKEYCFVLQALNDGELLGQEASSLAHELMDTGDVGMEKFSLLAGSGYVFCYTIVLPSLLVCDVSVSLLPIYYCPLALSDTTGRLTIIPIPQPIINRPQYSLTYHLTGTRKPWITTRQPMRSLCVSTTDCACPVSSPAWRCFLSLQET